MRLPLVLQDFDEAGYKWTPELCRKDSDGDGFTNGQELGDPDCTWIKGWPQRTALAHPGISTSKPPPAASGK
jgi:dopamine beta-monooxygenase